jgi:protein-tyrosine phosphatase
MDESARAMINQYGADSTCFSARPLTETILSDTDLVLTAARGHRSAVLSLRPALARSTFTIIELARIVASTRPDELPGTADPAARLRRLVERASVMRLTVAPRHRDDDDIDDPHGKSLDAYQRATTGVHRAILTIVSAMGAAPDAGRDRSSQ